VDLDGFFGHYGFGFLGMFLKGPGHEGILQRMRNLRRVLHDVELNWSVKPL